MKLLTCNHLTFQLCKVPSLPNMVIVELHGFSIILTSTQNRNMYAFKHSSSAGII